LMKQNLIDKYYPKSAGIAEKQDNLDIDKVA